MLSHRKMRPLRSSRPQRLRGKPLTKDEMEEMLQPLGGKYLNIVAGDRVVLLEGRDKGKIGEIVSTAPRRGECVVKGLNMVSCNPLSASFSVPL